MRIATITLILVLLDFIELICSEPRTLEDLFPRYNGGMPPVGRFYLDDQLRNFTTFGTKSMFLIPRYYVRRDHILFGWTWEMEGTIGDLSCLFDGLENVFIVFNMNEEKWVTLPRDLYLKLGTNRLSALVFARDEIAFTHKLTSNDPVYKEAHIRACRTANDRVDIVEQEQEELLSKHQTTMLHSIVAVKEEYSRTYNRAFSLYLYQHGEYNINGHKER